MEVWLLGYFSGFCIPFTVHRGWRITRDDSSIPYKPLVTRELTKEEVRKYIIDKEKYPNIWLRSYDQKVFTHGKCFVIERCSSCFTVTCTSRYSGEPLEGYCPNCF